MPSPRGRPGWEWPVAGLEEALLGYVIAAYALVVGSLLAYGIWVNAQRRALRRAASGEPERVDSGGSVRP